MVVRHKFKDLFDISFDTDINLPTYKEKQIKVKYENSKDLPKANVTHQHLPFAKSNIINCDIVKWKRLSRGENARKPVYEITFDTKDTNLDFCSGDTIGILPHNKHVEVEFVIQHLNMTAEADLIYTLDFNNAEKFKLPLHIPRKSSLRYVLTHCTDLRGIVKKLFLLALSHHTKDERERKVLEFLCSKEGSSAYTTYILDNNVSVLDIFDSFKTCKPPVEVLLVNLPRLLPRPYSLVNSGKCNSNTFKICFSVMDIGNLRKGLTTGWLEELILQTDSCLEDRIQNMTLVDNEMQSFMPQVPVYLRNNVSGFTLPNDLKRSVIMVATGTGIAPFMSFLEEFKYYKDRNAQICTGNVWLFYGCRNPEIDFIYEEELNSFVKDKVLSNLVTAFSKLSEKSKYVQDALREYAQDITKLIQNGAYVYVCGNHKTMASQVRETFVECLHSCAGFTVEEANKYVVEMAENKRFLTDIWS